MMPYSGVRPAGMVPFYLPREIGSLGNARPADLPLEQSARFELVINMKTAKTLDLTIPQSILIRADQVIQ